MWYRGGITDLGTLPLEFSERSLASGINDRGIIVGEVVVSEFDDDHAAVWMD